MQNRRYPIGYFFIFLKNLPFFSLTLSQGGYTIGISNKVCGEI